ncbi:hypothetical protein [Azospirillum sp. SYSU D00513]|uniref:hypothetical protein n=1 Tax=Azospirillum sp. SYSU D00513 TaxID=2812561 RepID=UPI001A967899|nr:hypothetical protein [Azospirillum sp. SYSU D00513]
MDPDKLAKVLAMAESEHEGEALSALRAARVLLGRSGLSLRDLAQAARPVARPVTRDGDAGAGAAARARPSPPGRTPPPDQLVPALRRQVQELEREVAALRRQIDRSSGEAERQRDEADRWRGIARETADRLWDLGKSMEGRHSRHSGADRRRAVLEHLRDPGSALLSDQEIARRVGVPASLVGHWRRRLAIVARKIRLLPVVTRGRGLLGAWAGRPALPNLARCGLPNTLQRGLVDAPRRRWAGSAAALPGTITIAGRAGGPPSRQGTSR